MSYSADVGSETPDAVTSTLALLDQLALEDPGRAEKLLQSEIADFLGAVEDPIVETPPSGAMGRGPSPQSTVKGAHHWYAQLSAQVPAFDDARNKEAAVLVEAGLLARERLQSDAQARMSRDELSELHTVAEQGERAWQWLITSNLRLVFHWSRGVAKSIDPDWAEDAFQAGCIGLIRGLERWDCHLGYKLSTFVSWHIRQAIERWRSNDVSIIRVPVHVHEAMRSADPVERAKAMRVAKVSITLASLEVVNEQALDAPWDGGLPEIENRLSMTWMCEDVLGVLHGRDREVIEMRYGFRDGEQMTLDNIGLVFDVTRERIRQIESKALTRLRAEADRLGLSLELE